jgi:hypothetical protein
MTLHSLHCSYFLGPKLSCYWWTGNIQWIFLMCIVCHRPQLSLGINKRFKHKLSLAYNVKLSHFVSFWHQKLIKWVSLISCLRSWHNRSVTGARNWHIFFTFWSQYFLPEFRPIEKEEKKNNLNMLCFMYEFNRNKKIHLKRNSLILKISGSRK